MSPEANIIVTAKRIIEIEAQSVPGLLVVAAGNIGPRGPVGPQGQWEAITQEEYDLLTPPDPNTLYIIIE